MSKLYKRYLELKESDSSILYLFECGKFYIFIDEDSKRISSITTLKLTKLTNDILKCGFPSNVLDKYLEIFNNLNLNVKIINSEKDNLDKLINKIKSINIDNITPIESINILRTLKEYINE